MTRANRNIDASKRRRVSAAKGALALDWRSSRSGVNPLSVLTISHIVMGYMNFRANLIDAENRMLSDRVLTPAQVSTVELLQCALQRRRLNGERFERCVERIFGDILPHSAFVGFHFMGSVMRCVPRIRFLGLLRLCQAQRQSTMTIFDNLHDTIDHYLLASHMAICRNLSTTQMRCLQMIAIAPKIALIRQLESGLRLTPDQQSSIHVELAILRHHVCKAHKSARQSFLKTLSLSQLQKLHIIENAA